MEHSFNIDIAQKYGVNEAILYNHLLFWIKKNKANGKNYKDGRFWTYSSIKALCSLFLYLSEKQIRTAVKKLIDAKVLVKSCYNNNPYDRTSWYAFNEEPEDLKAIENPYIKKQQNQEEENMEEPKKENTFSRSETSICPNGKMEEPKKENDYTDILTDILTDIEPDILTNGVNKQPSPSEKTLNAEAPPDFENINEIASFGNWSFEYFKKCLLVWIAKMTASPVNDLNQILKHYELENLENNFNRRVNNCGMAIVYAIDDVYKYDQRFRKKNFIDFLNINLTDNTKFLKSRADTEGVKKYINMDFYKP